MANIIVPLHTSLSCPAFLSSASSQCIITVKVCSSGSHKMKGIERSISAVTHSCTGQYLYFPGCALELTKQFSYLAGRKPKNLHSSLYTTFDPLRHLAVARIHAVVTQATNRLMHGRSSAVQDIPSTVYYTALGLRPRAV